MLVKLRTSDSTLVIVASMIEDIMEPVVRCFDLSTFSPYSGAVNRWSTHLTDGSPELYHYYENVTSSIEVSDDAFCFTFRLSN